MTHYPRARALLSHHVALVPLFPSLLRPHFRPQSTSSQQQQPTVRSLLASLTSQFQASSVPEPELSAKYLLSHVLGASQAHHHEQHLEEHLDQQQSLQLAALVQCRLARMPVQYLLGSWDFHSISLAVRPPVFLPRPETEELVEVVLARLPPGPCSILEIGPGTGAISLALLSARPDLTVTAVERSSAAVELTRHNADLLGLGDRITVIHDRVEKVQLAGCTFTAVVSNPPYVLRADLPKLAPEIHVYEDLRALDGGSEGLDVILPILELAASLLEDRQTGFVALEVDPCHALLLPPKLEAFYAAETIKDFNDKDRFMVMRLKEL